MRHWLNIDRLVRLGLVLMVLGTPAAVANPPTTDAYLARQAAALRPAFQADLAALANAPRYVIEARIDPEKENLSRVQEQGNTLTIGLRTNDDGQWTIPCT